MSLTATTPILNPSNERNATILDASGCLAALRLGIPQFMLSSTLPVRLALEHYGGGGGGGDPLDRDPERVLDTYVSAASARDGYGVVPTRSLEALDLTVDEPATAVRRAAMRRARGGAT